MKVDAVVQLRKLFHSRTGAAPERVILGIEGLPRAGSDRKIVLGVSRGEFDGAEPMIVEGPLVVVEVARIRGPAIQMPGELEHVVSAAALSGIGALLQLRC